MSLSTPLTTPAPAAEKTRVLSRTTTVCPVCLRLLVATLEDKNGDVWMRKNCPEHGEALTLYWKDTAFFEEATRRISPRVNICPEPACAKGETCHDHFGRTANILLNITERCNWDCPSCFSESGRERPDMTLDWLRAHLTRGPLPKSRTTVAILGGEPTVHKDLPEIIRYVQSLGYTARLVTNGSRLGHEDYLRKLHAAGLRWVILQFDGFDDAVHESFRRQPGLLAKRLAVIEACRAMGIKVQFATMVKRDVNLDQVGKIVRFDLENPHIFWQSFYPHSVVNKEQTPDAQTHVIDVMRQLEEDLDGQVSVQDWLDTMDLINRLRRFSPHQYLTLKLNTFGLLLFKEGNRVVPVNRLWGLRGAWRHRRVLLGALGHAGAYFNFESRQVPPGALFLSVQKFSNDDALDLQMTSQSHQAFLTERGLVPFDIYNVYYRKAFGI